jgi:hypothetical protein
MSLSLKFEVVKNDGNVATVKVIDHDTNREVKEQSNSFDGLDLGSEHNIYRRATTEQSAFLKSFGKRDTFELDEDDHWPELIALAAKCGWSE